MSFLRTFRSNLILSTAPPESKTGSMKASAAPGGPGAGRRNSSQHEERVASGTTRRSSGTVGLSGRNGGRPSGADGGRYGKENPAPIVVYLDKPGQEAKKPASILRTNTFTTSKSKPADHSPEPEQIRYATAAITRSDTFTIDEPDDVSTGHTGTYTRRGSKDAPSMDVFEPLYVKNIELDSHELPVVVDSRTYRKKSRSTSKPVQKVESFIKRFERTLFNKHGANERRKQSVGSARKNSTSVTGAADAGPRFRDVGINCKLDEEDRFRAKVEAMRKVRQGSRDSITSVLSTVSRRERSQSPSKRYTQSHDRRSSSASSFVLGPLEELSNRRTPSPAYGGTTIPLAVDRPTESSFLKSRQKEIEMGYSVVNKRQQPLTLPVGERRSPEERPHSTIVSRSHRPAGYAEEDARPASNREQHYSTYVIARNATSREDKGPRFRSDTYRTLKEEFEQQQQLATKPIGIASPLCGEGRVSKGPAAPSKDASGELPKYTFGVDLQQRRTRFQQFQRSFKKMDDSASEVSVQQSFFVPL
ncbi:uncharacterized protein LOC131214393 [Anopheles bellator]|uniref:uncharacterized protein LOC131214393 n=1 Tax=Anopheles bellator TaxID=139047 RepID=UPI002649F172|nr:uncharacterized protein LOC131214393 [Anopheles bellator]